MLQQDCSLSLADWIAAGEKAERAADFEEALTAYESAFRLLGKEGSAVHAAELFRWIGRVRRYRGELELALEAYETSRAIAEAASEIGHVASAINCQAIIAQLRGNMEEAATLYGNAHDLAEAARDQRLAAIIDQNAGTLANIRGDFNVAICSYHSALTKFRALGDQMATVWSLNNLGMAYTDLRDWDNAGRSFDEAFELADHLRDSELLGTVELNRAEMFLKFAQLGQARDCCDRAFEIFSQADIQNALGETYKVYGQLYRRMGRPGLASAHFEQAIDIALAMEDRLLEAEAQSEWALLELDAGENRAALQRLNRAHQLFREMHANAQLMDLESRMDRLEETYLRVMQQWAESIESKDRYTAGHCERVANYACMLAAEVGISGRDLTWFRMGAFLHDVGKTEVPAEILNKPGKLTPEDWESMKRHAVAGDEIVAELNFPWDIRPIVRNHHERWDGTGYPDQLRGEDIPLTARVLCVADVFDALTTARSYRPALSREEALRIMQRDSGKLLDPNLFELFCRLLNEQQPTVSALRNRSVSGAAISA